MELRFIKGELSQIVRKNGTEYAIKGFILAIGAIRKEMQKDKNFYTYQEITSIEQNVHDIIQKYGGKVYTMNGKYVDCLVTDTEAQEKIIDEINSLMVAAILVNNA